MEIYQILKKPIITERTTALKEQNNKYVFRVDINANKTEIKRAVEKLFKVKVVKVHTAIFPGKTRRVGANVGQRPAWKKSIVTLRKGQRIELAGT